jgi:hypothetical protein
MKKVAILVFTLATSYKLRIKSVLSSHAAKLAIFLSLITPNKLIESGDWLIAALRCHATRYTLTYIVP